ncbi:hypothetical protein ACO0QE_001931 [Hanseniaspora vineae]
MNHSPSPKRNWQSSARDTNTYGSSAYRMNNMPYTSRPLNDGGFHRALNENNDEFVVPDYKDNARIMEELRNFKKTATVRESELFQKIDGLESLCNLLKKKLESYKNKCDNLELVDNDMRRAHDKRQDDLKKTIRDLENVIQDQEAKIVDQERTIELQRNTITSHETVIQDQTKSIENQASTIKDHIETIDAQNTTIKNQKQKLSDLEDQLETRERKIELLTEKLEISNTKSMQSTPGKHILRNGPNQRSKKKYFEDRKHSAANDSEADFLDENNESEAPVDEDGYYNEQNSDDYDSDIGENSHRTGSTKNRTSENSTQKSLKIRKNSKSRSPINNDSKYTDGTVSKLLQKVDTLMNYLEDCTKNNKVPNFVDGRVASKTQGVYAESSASNLSSTTSSRKPTENDILLFENEELSDLLKTVTDMREKVSLRKKAEISRKLLLQEIEDLHKEMEGNKESTTVFKNQNNQEMHSQNHIPRNETTTRHLYANACPSCEQEVSLGGSRDENRINGSVHRTKSVIVNEEHERPSLADLTRKRTNKKYSTHPDDYIDDGLLK